MTILERLEGLAYSDGRPNWWGRLLNRIVRGWASTGFPPTFNQVALEVPGRRSGVPRRTVVLVGEHLGAEYLVSMLGPDSEWLRNIRASGGAAAIVRRRRRIPIHLVEVPVEERAPIIKAWAKRAVGGRHFLGIPFDSDLGEYAAIAARHPVYRIDRKAAPRPG